MNIGKAILIVSLLAAALILFPFLTGLIKVNVGIPSSPADKETTISRVITEGKVSVFEDNECRKSVQAIDWGKVESNHQYFQAVYIKNDNQEEWLDSGKRDIIWQRENVNPTSVYVSIKVNYGDTKIRPNEVRQANITLTVLGLLDDSGRLDPSSDIPKFTFDLKLIGKDLNPIYPPIPQTYVRRDAPTNITVVYKDELKETVSVIIEIGIWRTQSGKQTMDVVWNSTKYGSEFTESWLYATRYISYQLVVTINHERYGTLTYRNYLVGQLP